MRMSRPYLLPKWHTALRYTTACGVPLGKKADVVYSGTHRCAICQHLRGWPGGSSLFRRLKPPAKSCCPSGTGRNLPGP